MARACFELETTLYARVPDPVRRLRGRIGVSPRFESADGRDLVPRTCARTSWSVRDSGSSRYVGQVVAAPNRRAHGRLAHTRIGIRYLHDTGGRGGGWARPRSAAGGSGDRDGASGDSRAPFDWAFESFPSIRRHWEGEETRYTAATRKMHALQSKTLSPLCTPADKSLNRVEYPHARERCVRRRRNPASMPPLRVHAPSETWWYDVVSGREVADLDVDLRESDASEHRPHRASTPTPAAAAYRERVLGDAANIHSAGPEFPPLGIRASRQLRNVLHECKRDGGGAYSRRWIGGPYADVRAPFRALCLRCRVVVVVRFGVPALSGGWESADGGCRLPLHALCSCVH